MDYLLFLLQSLWISFGAYLVSPNSWEKEGQNSPALEVVDVLLRFSDQISKIKLLKS